MSWHVDLLRHRSNLYSQAGEDGILRHIFDHIGAGGKYCVEFGAGNGIALSNTKQFRDEGWDGLLLEGVPRGPGVHQAWITRENINQLLNTHDVPPVIDLISIDIDGNDLWVWEAISRKMRVAVVEYNPRWGPTESKSIVYNPDHHFDETAYYGASLLALKRCGLCHKMRLVCYNGLNAFFVEQEALPANFDLPLVYTPAPGWMIRDAGRQWVDY